MGDKVWQVQKELEELQARTHGSTEVTAASDPVPPGRRTRQRWPTCRAMLPFGQASSAAKPVKKTDGL